MPAVEPYGNLIRGTLVADLIVPQGRRSAGGR
jgi:hypothetical protein